MEINLSNILYDVENFLYELFLWIALFPKTLFQAFIRPSWIHKYINDEWQKEQKERFKDYLNPLIFWIFSYIMILWSVSLGNYAPLTLGQLIIELMVFSLYPIAYAMIMVRFTKATLNKNDFRRPLYIQMMTFGVNQTILAVFLAPLIYLNANHMELPTSWTVDEAALWGIHVSLLLALFIPFIWTLFAEIGILNKEFQSDLSKLLIGWSAGLILFVLLLVIVPSIEKEALYTIGLMPPMP